MELPPSFVYEHFDTVLISTNGSVAETEEPCDSNISVTGPSNTKLLRAPSPRKRGVFAYIVPINRLAKESLRRLAVETKRDDTSYHRGFLESPPDELKIPSDTDCFILSLDLLPEVPGIGWRIGRGRKKLKNLGVDLLLSTEDDDIAGLHARLSWLKGGGGFFLIADNQRGLTVNLNGEELSYTQRLIPYQNAIGIGQLFFSIKFLERSPAQEEQFQSQLLLMYSAVLRENTPFIMPTPSRSETRIGDWVVRAPLGKGSFGHVSSVTNIRTGQLAAAKEIWRTPKNSLSVDREVSICYRLKNVRHERLAVPFDITHEKVHNRVERNRIISLLDETWRPGANDTIDKYILYLPLATSNFYALITSNASREIRTELFAQILEGLAFLHNSGISHRDIKPGNLAVTSFDPPWARILDFGSATVAATTLYDSPGTVTYLAPEQEPGKYHDCSVDYWAVALVGLEILKYRLSGRVDASQLARVRQWLDDQERVRYPHPVAVCSRAMLQWEPRDRVSAEDVLSVHLAEHRYSSYRDRKRNAESPQRRAKKLPSDATPHGNDGSTDIK